MSLDVCLRLKFGPDGLQLLPEIRALQDHEVVEAVLDAIESADTPDELRRVWTRKRRKTKGKQS